MSYIEEIRRQVEGAPRSALPAVTAALWRAFAEGQVSEAEAEALSGLIQARQAPSLDRRTVARAADPAPLAGAGIVRRYGSKPRSPESTARRRRWAASGRLPPNLAWQFTLAEQAVLAVVAVEVGKAGFCAFHLDHLAGLAGVSRSTVKNALREAQRLGLVTVEARRVGRYRNEANIVRIVSGEWLSWMRLARRETRIPGEGGWVKSVTGTHTSDSETGPSRPARPSERGLAGGGNEHRQGQDGPPMRQGGPWRPSTGFGRRM